MKPVTSKNRHGGRRLPADVASQAAGPQPIESWIPFILLMAFMLTFYLRFPARFPVIAPLRPELLLALLTAGSLIPYLSHRSDVLRLPVARPLNWLVFWVIVSLPFVAWPGSVLRNNWYPFFKVLLMFYFVILAVDTPTRLRWFVFAFVGCQVFRVLEPLYMNLTTGFLTGSTYLGEGEFAGRLTGAPADVINANGLGFVISTTVVFVHFLLWQSPSKLAKLIYVVVLPGMLYALILTMSRGGFIALLVGGGLIFLQSRHKAGLVAAAVVLAIVGWSAMTDIQKDRYISLVSSESRQSGSAQGRLRGIMNEFKLGMNRPIFGHGVGTTPEAKVNVLGERSKAAHNLYAELLIEVGVVGFILFMTFIVRTRQLIRGNLQRLGSLERTHRDFGFFVRLNRALLAVFWVYAVYSINYYGLSRDYWYVFGSVCVAFGLVVLGLTKNRNHERPRMRCRGIVSL